MTTALDFIATLDNISDNALDLLDSSGYADLPVVWNSRLRTSAGRCHYEYRNGRPRASKIELNPSLRSEGAEATRNTFLHELAHAVAGHKANHGAFWKRTHRALGGDASRCHSYASMPRKSQARKVVGRCERCDYEVIRAKALPANRTFKHLGLKCGGTIIPVRGR